MSVASRALDKRNWTLLAYVAGDNNLSRAGRTDIEELAKVGINPNIHAAAEFDARVDHFRGSIRYEFTPPDPALNRGHAKIIDHLDEKNSGDPSTFRAFLDWGLERYPAENVLVVVWGHGHGFKDFTKSVGDDTESNASIDMPELKQALAESLRKTGVRKLALLGFDACLMSMLEVAFELKDLTHFIVGSQQTERADGWPYDKVLEEIKKLPAPLALGEQIVEQYIKFHQTQGFSNGTQSVIETARVERAVEALASLADTLSEGLSSPGFRSKIETARMGVLAFDASDYVDVTDLCKALGDIPEAKPKAAAFREAANACIRFQKHTADLPNASGLSLWFPLSKALYLLFRPQYARLAIHQKSRAWLQFLDKFFVS